MGEALESVRRLLGEVWSRATSVQPGPAPEVELLLGVAALAVVLLPGTWPYARLVVTVVHEAGHAVVAVLVGRRLQAIRLHSDTSGLTVSRGRPRGPGMILMLLAGYLAPAAVGLASVLLLVADRSMAVLWIAVLVLLMMLVHVRNLYGLGVLLALLGAVVAVAWWLDPALQALVAHQLTWLLLLAAPRPVVELVRSGRRGSGTSDADQLARLTRVPALVWTLLFLAASLAGLVVGATTLVPALL